MKNERSARHSYVADEVTVGFLTDPTLCIGCKACEVACKEWNDVPSNREGEVRSALSYDYSGELGANQWRHVKFVEQETETGQPRWLFLSDVCKHCERAGCLDACPTGAIRRTEVGSVLVEDSVCNGCGYCVVSCPFGVIDRRGRGPGEENAGGAYKCTFCFDRQSAGKLPACANACPTDSILFGPLVELRDRATSRVAELSERGVDDASIYDPASVGGVHALSILAGGGSSGADELQEANARLWGLPTDPVAPSELLAGVWAMAVVAIAATGAACWFAFGSAA